MDRALLPIRAELPTRRGVIRQAIAACILAAVLAVTVVLPAELAFDPTGIGRLVGVTQMGEFKQGLATAHRR